MSAATSSVTSDDAGDKDLTLVSPELSHGASRMFVDYAASAASAKDLRQVCHQTGKKIASYNFI